MDCQGKLWKDVVYFVFVYCFEEIVYCKIKNVIVVVYWKILKVKIFVVGDIGEVVDEMYFRIVFVFEQQ